MILTLTKIAQPFLRKYIRHYACQLVRLSVSWELWILLISTVLGKIDDLRKNGKSYSIKRYFFMEKQKILPQFDDPTT